MVIDRFVCIVYLTVSKNIGQIIWRVLELMRFFCIVCIAASGCLCILWSISVDDGLYINIVINRLGAIGPTHADTIVHYLNMIMCMTIQICDSRMISISVHEFKVLQTLQSTN